jgi:hypothetical protein
MKLFVATLILSLGYVLVPAYAKTPLTESDKADFQSSLLVLTECQVFYGLRTIALVEAGESKSQRYTEAINGGLSINLLLRLLTEEHLNAKGIAGYNKFLKARMAEAVEEYQPQSPKALDNLYDIEIINKISGCDAIINDSAELLGRMQ